MSKAISPKQVAAKKAESFPDYVFDAFNELIAENFSAGSAKVTQDKAVQRILDKANAGISDQELDDEFGGYGRSLSRAQLFERGYLNIEEVYRAQGWDVDYHKAYAFMNDMGPSYFTFRSK